MPLREGTSRARITPIRLTAPSPASPLANALAQMAGALTTVTAGISALSSDKDARKPCCVWGGFGRFQTYLGATTRCLLFAGTGGGIYPVGKPPPYSLCFVLFSLSIANVHSRPRNRT